MEKIEANAEISNYANDCFQSANETDDELLPIASKEEGTRKNSKRSYSRKRSVSLPFTDDHGGVCQGSVATEGLQFMKAEEGCRTKRRQKQWENPNQKTFTEASEQSLARRSLSMPEFYTVQNQKQKHVTKISTFRSRDKLVVDETDLKGAESFKLPLIPGSQNGQSRENVEIGVADELNHKVENLTIQRKTYLPRINSNNGNIFMKSR